jgi:hypothetical protein
MTALGGSKRHFGKWDLDFGIDLSVALEVQHFGFLLMALMALLPLSVSYCFWHLVLSISGACTKQHWREIIFITTIYTSCSDTSSSGA